MNKKYLLKGMPKIGTTPATQTSQDGTLAERHTPTSDRGDGGENDSCWLHNVREIPT